MRKRTSYLQELLSVRLVSSAIQTQLLNFTAWYIQHEFSDCRCDMVCIWYNDNCLTAKFKSNSFQSIAPRL